MFIGYHDLDNITLRFKCRENDCVFALLNIIEEYLRPAPRLTPEEGGLYSIKFPASTELHISTDFAEYLGYTTPEPNEGTVLLKNKVTTHRPVISERLLCGVGLTIGQGIFDASGFKTEILETVVIPGLSNETIHTEVIQNPTYYAFDQTTFSRVCLSVTNLSTGKFVELEGPDITPFTAELCIRKAPCFRL